MTSAELNQLLEDNQDCSVEEMKAIIRDCIAEVTPEKPTRGDTADDAWFDGYDCAIEGIEANTKELLGTK